MQNETLLRLFPLSFDVECENGKGKEGDKGGMGDWGIGPTAGNNALFYSKHFFPNSTSHPFHFFQIFPSKSLALPNLKAFSSSHALSTQKIPKFSPNYFLLADSSLQFHYTLQQFSSIHILHYFRPKMVAHIVASTSLLSFTLFVVILSASIFGGEVVIAQQKPPLNCASSLAPGNEHCEEGFCFDLFDIQSDSIKSGCTYSAAKCPSSGCFLLPNTQKFLCCCSHPFCNGKSPYLIRARWRMYLKGDYPAKVLRKSPRDVSREMAENTIGNVDSGVGIEQMRNSTTTTMTTKKAITLTSTKMATTTMKKAPTPSSSQKSTTMKMMTTKKPTNVKTTINPKNSTKAMKTTNTTKMSMPTTNSPPKTTQKASTLATNSSEFVANKSTEQIAEKGLEILDFNGNGTTNKKEEEKKMDSGTTTAAKIQKEMAKVTEKMMDIKNSTLQPLFSSTIMSIKTTQKQSTAKFVSTAKSTTKASTIQVNETTSIQSKSTISPSSTSPKNENLSIFLSTPKSMSIKPSYSEPFTLFSSSKRTTRSPSPQPPTTIRTTLGPWEPAVPSFPWYFIALAGFLSSSAVFLLVYWTVKGCRRIFQKRIRNGRSLGDDGGQLGEPMIPMGNGHNLDGKATKMEKENRPKKRAVPKANGQMMMSSKTTNESLMSQCTASTEIGEQQQQQQKIAKIDMEYGGGEQVTVIDPLLNQQYNGTMNK